MKYFSFIALSMIPTFAMSETVTLPSSKCSEILSFEYSSGNGDTIVHQMDILCKNEDGKFYGFIVEKPSLSGLFGMGRIDIPDEISFVFENVTDATWK